MKDRMKELRVNLGLTQKEFADRIGVKQSTIATYEIGRNNPSDTVIALICREFGVDEIWLRTGTGEMFRPASREEEIAAFVGDVLHDEPGSFRKGLVSALAALTTEDWKVLEKLALEAIERARKSSEEDAGINAQKIEDEKRLIPLPPAFQQIHPGISGLDDDNDPKTEMATVPARNGGLVYWALSEKQFAQYNALVAEEDEDSAADDV